MNEVETAKYRITGLVDKFDEQMNIVGQFEIGSVQELPVEVGVKLVGLGTAEAVGTEEGEESEGATGATGEESTNGATGATGEENETGDEEDEKQDEVE